MSFKSYDIFIIGGGINGVGIAREAARLGLKVALCEKGDFAAQTSSKSSRLIHGGLRYLEHYAFRLVKESLRERDVLYHMAPHLIKPLKFILPYKKHMRPFWLMFIGLKLYDLLAGRQNKLKSRIERNLHHQPFLSDVQSGFSYYDYWVDDARLVIANACSAKTYGAELINYKALIAAQAESGLWHLTLEDNTPITAKLVINATGGLVNQVLEDIFHLSPHAQLKWVQGSHIIVDLSKQKSNLRHFEWQAFTLQCDDGRIIFVLPVANDPQKLIIGTTDIALPAYTDTPKILPEEIEYLLAQARTYLNLILTEGDIISHYTGIRPLYDDGNHNASAVTRDYVLKWQNNAPLPLLNIYGGKLTTYRKLAHHALRKISKHYPQLITKQHIKRLAEIVPLPPLNDRASKRQGQHFGHNLYQNDIDHFLQYEFAKTAEDILWRRTKAGLYLNQAEIQALETYIKTYQPL